MDVLPTAYKLTIKTELDSATFAGTAEISLDILQPTAIVQLNTAAPLELLGAVLIVQDGARLVPCSTEYDDKHELLKLSFAQEVQAGTAALGLRWRGRLDHGGMLGYYRIPYPDESGGDYYAVTQLQATLARRVFPCFDHPAKKATFAVSLISPAGLTSLSNTPQIARQASQGQFTISNVLTEAFLSGREGQLGDGDLTQMGGDWELIDFETTPIMSTYLVAWAVGKFSHIASSYTSPLTQRQIPLRLYASTPHQHVEKGQGQLALDTLARVMPIYEKMFDIPFELPKLDILVCDAFDAGAMENYGLITGKTLHLLHDEASSGAAGERMVVSTVSHEAAHGWFGNLVSMAWWDDLWLNEGFATLMGEVVVLNEIYPSWKVHSSFIKYHRTSALELDSLRSSHPVQLACDDDSEEAITQSFDAISYEKGSAVLKMLSDMMGQDVFLRGVSTYLKTHAHGSATSNDLWRALSDASRIDVAALMNSWITKVGFPVVTAEETEDSIVLRQSRFLSSGDASAADDTTVWTLPLGLKVVGSSEKPQQLLMSTKEMTITKPDGLWMLNAETSGTFRVSYPATHLEKLASAQNQLSLLDRLGLIQDTIALSEAGYTPTSSALSFLSRFSVSTEPEQLVWVEVAQAFHRLLDVWWEQPEEVLEGIKALARKLFGPLVAKLGYRHEEGDDAEARQFRVLALAAAAAAEEPDVISFMQQSFARLLSGDPDPTLADLSAIIVREAVRHSDTPMREYGIALQIFKNPPTPQHQLAAISGLTAPRELNLLMQTANMCMTGEVPEQSMPQVFHGLASNPTSRRAVWHLTTQAWSMLEAKFAGSFHLGKIAQFAFQSLTTQQDADMVEKFFADKDTSAYAQPLQQGLDTLRSRARRLERDTEDVRNWLEREGYLATEQ